MGLARLTRRDTPTAVSGPWDFAGVLAGLSGFIVVGGGLVLSLFQSNFRFWMRGNLESLRAVWVQERTTWILFALAYLLVVIGCGGLALVGRRRTLVVYNVEPAAFETALVEVFEQLGRSVERRGNLWSGTAPLCEVDAFVAGRTVTVRWVSEDVRLYEEVVRLLRAALAAVGTAENPVTHWLTAGAVGSGLLAVCSCGLLLYALALMGR
jgi:hypothetical protein